MGSDVNHPSHYNSGNIEVIEAIDDWKLGFYEGNVVKYVARAKHKGKQLEDLKKAAWYLNRLIEQVEFTPAQKSHDEMPHRENPALVRAAKEAKAVVERLENAKQNRGHLEQKCSMCKGAGCDSCQGAAVPCPLCHGSGEGGPPDNRCEKCYGLGNIE